jgi:hypothetical protein
VWSSELSVGATHYHGSGTAWGQINMNLYRRRPDPNQNACKLKCKFNSMQAGSHHTFADQFRSDQIRCHPSFHWHSFHFSLAVQSCGVHVLYCTLVHCRGMWGTCDAASESEFHHRSVRATSASVISASVSSPSSHPPATPNRLSVGGGTASETFT